MLFFHRLSFFVAGSAFRNKLYNLTNSVIHHMNKTILHYRELSRLRTPSWLSNHLSHPTLMAYGNPVRTPTGRAGKCARHSSPCHVQQTSHTQHRNSACVSGTAAPPHQSWTGLFLNAAAQKALCLLHVLNCPLLLLSLRHVCQSCITWCAYTNTNTSVLDCWQRS